MVRAYDLQTAEAILVPRRSGGGASRHCDALRGRQSTLSPVDLSREEGQASTGKQRAASGSTQLPWYRMAGVVSPILPGGWEHLPIEIIVQMLGGRSRNRGGLWVPVPSSP